MPGKVKLLNAAPGGTTGLAYNIGTGAPPLTIRTDGGYTQGAGVAGTNGVNIEVSTDGGVTWGRVWGNVGGQNFTETAGPNELVDLPDKSIVAIPFYPGHHIRALTGAGMGGTATVWLEFVR